LPLLCGFTISGPASAGAATGVGPSRQGRSAAIQPTATPTTRPVARPSQKRTTLCTTGRAGGAHPGATAADECATATVAPVACTSLHRRAALLACQAVGLEPVLLGSRNWGERYKRRLQRA
jgi:hypothetical protein